MASFIVRLPGSEVTEELPGFPGVRVVYKYPNEQTAREVKTHVNRVAKQADAEIDAGKAVFGMLFERLEGVDNNGEDTFVFEKDKRGHVTKECLEAVLPLFSDLWIFALDVVGYRVRGGVAKN